MGRADRGPDCRVPGFLFGSYERAFRGLLRGRERAAEREQMGARDGAVVARRILLEELPVAFLGLGGVAADLGIARGAEQRLGGVRSGLGGRGPERTLGVSRLPELLLGVSEPRVAEL